MDAWKINEPQIKSISNDRIRRRKSRDQSINNYRDQKRKKNIIAIHGVLCPVPSAFHMAFSFFIFNCN